MKKREKIKISFYLIMGILGGLFAFVFSIIELVSPAKEE
jgi:hypothetical protein